jgi:enterobactin synthetase component D / holo-[acyl-carrier protein] synthase
MLERLLPASVAVVQTRTEIDEPAPFPEEERLVARAVEKRRREFASGRACAHQAVAQLGLEQRPILSGEQGEPQWPEGVVGSITHCEGYRGCAVAHRQDLASIGVDAELDAPLPAGLLADIALPEERRRLAVLARGEPGVSWDRLLFSAKESVYKAWFPLAGRWLGFEDASLELNPRERSFVAQLLVPGPSLGGVELRRFSGRWSIGEGTLFTAIAVAAPASP